MSIDDCLSAFSIAAILNAPTAAADAKVAVTEFLLSKPDSARLQLAVACELKAAFEKLQITNLAADEIRRDLDVRISGLEASITVALTFDL